MKKQTQGFTLVIALTIVILVSLIAMMLLEYMIPFSRNVQGVENASKAHYEGYK